MRVIVTRIIVSTISLYFTRHKIIIRIKSNVFCICVYNGRYYTLPHWIIEVFFVFDIFDYFYNDIYRVSVISCLLINISNKNAKYVTKIRYITNIIHVMIK